MTITRKHKFYAALLSMGFSALMVDHLVGGEATTVQAAVAAMAAQSPESAVAATPANVVERLASRLQTLDDGAELSDMRDAFKPAAGWVAATRPAPVVQAAPAGNDFANRHVVTALFVSDKAGGAIVDGNSIRVGQTLDGFTLVSVRRGAAQFAGHGITVDLRLSR